MTGNNKVETKQRILLTGATGFLGSHLLEALLREQYPVVILKRSTSDSWRIKHLLKQVTSYDVDKEPVTKAFDDCQIDMVVHLATLYRKFDNGHEVPQMVHSNIGFPLELIECAVRYGAKGFINTGTFFECDCSQLPLREDAPEKPFNLYAKTKLAFESMLRTYADLIPTLTLRLFSPYGERDNAKLIPMVIEKALQGKTVELSDGLQKLDFIYVADVVSAYMKAIEKLDTLSRKHEVYNIGSGGATSVREVVSILEQCLGRPIDKRWGDPSAVDIPVVFADISKAATILGWVPEHSIHDGLKATLEYYRDRLVT